MRLEATAYCRGLMGGGFALDMGFVAYEVHELVSDDTVVHIDLLNLLWLLVTSFGFSSQAGASTK
jgi:hypothetical protein